MPNKDSFTFSDKLKKSKSLPLSKRIPSRVGGDGKAKRTLIQRAQRDLPFIIVAAAALLLLPLLSRNSGVEYPDGSADRYENWVGDGSTEWIGSGDGEIVPSTGYRNPLEYIITPKSGEDSAIHENVDIGDDSSNLDDANKSYVEEMPVRDTYKKAVKPAIRNAVQRKATAIGAFRNRSMSFGGAGSGLTRNLAIGGAPTTNGKAASVRAGVRPVALQPLKSAGAGRVLTGEGLYAEAARSLGALNQGPAKQALFEAQLRDVDGSPLGAAGDPRKAAARLASQGAVPDHKFHYTNQKPWWWDMMQDRSQKLWELWNYNWQKALSDSLIKISTNLAMCLLTGSEDGSVKNFLGIKGGSKDVCCLVDGMELCAGDIGDYTSSSTGSGDSKETTNNSFSSIQAFCKEHNAKTYISESGRKNALQARLECLGLKAGKLDWLSKTQYAADCDGVNKKPLVYSVSATSKGGKVREKDQNKMLIYVLAQVKGQNGKGVGDPFVIKLNEPKNNKLTISEDELKAIRNNCVITNVGSFRAKKDPSDALDRGDQFADKYNEVEAQLKAAQSKLSSATAAEKEQLEKDIAAYQAQIDRMKAENADNFDDEANAYSSAIGAVFASAQEAYNHCVNPKTNSINTADFLTRDKLVAKFGSKKRSEFIEEISSNECQVYDFNAKFEELTLNQGTSVSCLGTPVEGLEAAQTGFSAKITGVGGNKVYAAIVEDGEKDGTAGVFVRDLVPLSQEQNSNFVNGDVYSLPARMIGENSVTGERANPSHGRVYWIVTPKDLDVKAANKFIEGVYATQVDVSTLYQLKNAYLLEKCDYSWGCTANRCPSKPQQEQNIEGEFCAVKNGDSYNFYEAIKIPQGASAVYIQKKEAPVSADEKAAFFEKVGIADPDCPDCITQAIEDKRIFECTPICKYLLEENDRKGIYRRIGTERTGDPILNQTRFDEIDGLTQVLDNSALCPSCNPTAQEVLQTCNFASHLNFGTSRFTLDKDDEYTAMYKKFADCLTLLSENTSDIGQSLYITGFTSFAGSDTWKRCPTYNGTDGGIQDPTNGNAVDVRGTDGSTWKANYGRNGTSDTEARKNCNRALSEDRAVVSLQKLIERLNSDSLPLASKVTVTMDTSNLVDPPYVGFRNTSSREHGLVDAYNRYKNRDANNPYGSGDTNVRIFAKGCGPEGASSGDNPDDRVIYFTTENKECNRTEYKALINN